jgi:phospholipid-binding lipoprotein MlaA
MPWPALPRSGRRGGGSVGGWATLAGLLVGIAALAGCAAPPLVEPSYLAKDPAASLPTHDALAGAPQAAPARGAGETLPAPRPSSEGGKELPATTDAAVDAAAADPLPRDAPDPFESMNRKIFEGNQELNRTVLYPLAKAYREGLSEDVRDRIDAFTTNLSEPMVFANNVLQLRFDAAATTLARFITNSTVGLGGLWDVAATVGQKHQTGDFGETLYVWGVRDSAYIVMPVLGPSNLRDAVGTGISLIVPAGIIATVPSKLATATNYAATADAVSTPVAGLGKVGMLQEVEAGALDTYAVLRSMSDQKRQAELKEALSQSLFSGWPEAAPPGGEARVFAADGVFAAPAGLGMRP